MDYTVQKPARRLGVSLAEKSASFPSAQFYKRGDVQPIQLEKNTFIPHLLKVLLVMIFIACICIS